MFGPNFNPENFGGNPEEMQAAIAKFMETLVTTMPTESLEAVIQSQESFLTQLYQEKARREDGSG